MGKCNKLSPKYCGLFEILAKLGPTHYQLALPVDLKVHDVFHVSLKKICL